MQFVKLSTRYINLDTITHVDLQMKAQGTEVTGVTVYFLSGHQDSLSLAGEDARTLIAALTAPAQPSTLDVIAKAFGKTPEEVAAMMRSFGDTP